MSTSTILHIRVYRGGAKPHSAGLMDRSQHYILWCRMIMQHGE